VLIARTTDDVQKYLNFDDQQREAIGLAARKKVLQLHTAAARAKEFVTYINEIKSPVNV